MAQKKKIAKIKKPAVSKEKPAGRITHYFSKIKVAVIKLSAPLKEGDKIRVFGGEKTDFKQTVKSMQVDHKKVKTAGKGKSIGLEVKEPVREGYNVVKI